MSGVVGPLLLRACRLRMCGHSPQSTSVCPEPLGAFGQPRNLRDPQDLRRG